MKDILSPTAMSCLFTGAVAAKRDERQRIRTSYTMLDQRSRLLRAGLILEEAFETVKALGVKVYLEMLLSGRHEIEFKHLVLGDPADGDVSQSDFEGVIDGCCDTIYVATGLLVAMGVPDLPHLEEVCRANDSKFPNGHATIDPTTGKYLKPAGWTGPDHAAVAARHRHHDLASFAQTLVEPNGRK